MDRIGTKLNLYEVYFFEKDGVHYEASIGKDGIFVGVGSDIVATYDSDDAFLQSEIAGEKVETLISDGRMKVAEFIHEPVQPLL